MQRVTVFDQYVWIRRSSLVRTDVGWCQIRYEYVAPANFLEDGLCDRRAAGYVLSILINHDLAPHDILNLEIVLKLLLRFIQRTANQASTHVAGRIALPSVEQLD